MNGVVATIRGLVVSAALLPLALAGTAAEPAPLAKDWQFDTIRLKNGYVLKGLILEETPGIGCRFQHVRRAPGRPTVSMTSCVREADIKLIERISNEERELLKSRLKELDPTGEGERKRMEGLTLERCDWNGKPKAGWRYESDYFSLVSNSPEEVVRRSAVRLEQIYAAYAHFLPPRFPGGKTTTILLYHSFDDYQKMLAAQGWKLQNPAFFNPDSNRIVCGSKLLALGEDLEKARLANGADRAVLDEREAELRRLFGKKPAEFAKEMQSEGIPQKRKRIAEADRDNDGIFDNATRKLYSVLYHEAFHAYVGNFVLPPRGQDQAKGNAPGELPRWLNEGLAQIFETAIVEAGELRVGHADKERLQKVKECVRKGELMPVKDLLGSGPKTFLVQHNDERQASDRAYLASWALAAYLSFDRRLLGSPQLDAFIRSVNGGGNAEEAFAKLTGQKLAAFEKDFQAWLIKLPVEGSMLDPVVAKAKDR